MLITEIEEEECRSILVNASQGHLGCCFNEQPYVVPISFAFEPDYLYILSTSGQKVDWMRKNPKVCVQVDEIKNEVSWV
ncbi:MAG: pyridoxamine 5'-phosphate oxidase family protein, partial [Acidobacteria bacterium]|nr:pyridoxamine 5'-phosphate oxidase family protein [Acidobacteriota bacterium]